MAARPRPEAALAAALALTLAFTFAHSAAGAAATGAVEAAAVPRFAVDAAWPLPLPHGWMLGEVSGVATDADDHVWVLQRPRSLAASARAAAAPPVLEFDREGRLLRHWGGPGPGYDWPGNEHGIHVDGEGHVWITGNGPTDGQVLKFTREGRFVLQIGTVGAPTGSADTARLGRAAGVAVDTAAGEVYVADGYHNRRVIVFDARTGAYRRHWGAYGRPPVDAAPPGVRRGAPPTAQQRAHFGTPVHCVRLSRDGRVYVCDRQNNRVQVFRRDGGFVGEFDVEPQTTGNGTVWDLALSPEAGQPWLFVADGHHDRVLTLGRGALGDTGGPGATAAPRATLGRPGRQPGEFRWVHGLAVDSRGDLYTGEVDGGRRVQRFVRQP